MNTFCRTEMEIICLKIILSIFLLNNINSEHITGTRINYVYIYLCTDRFVMH